MFLLNLTDENREMREDGGLGIGVVVIHVKKEKGEHKVRPYQIKNVF